MHEFRFRRLTAWLAVLVAVALIAAGCGDDDDDSTSDGTDTKTETSEVVEEEDAAAADTSIVVLAQETPELSTLVKAVTAAALVDTLNGTDEYTVFAPTDDAFAAVPKPTLDALLAPAGKEDLTDLLTYHVVPGTIMAEDLEDGEKITTVNGAQLDVTVEEDGTVMVGDAKVVRADVAASNGVVHVIDKVLVPPAASTPPASTSDSDA